METLTKKTLFVTQTIVIISVFLTYAFAIYIGRLGSLETKQAANLFACAAILIGVVSMVAALFAYFDDCYLEVIMSFTAFTSFAFALFIAFKIAVAILAVISLSATLILINGKNFKKDKVARRLMIASLLIAFPILLAGFFSVFIFNI